MHSRQSSIAFLDPRAHGRPSHLSVIADVFGATRFKSASQARRAPGVDFPARLLRGQSQNGKPDYQFETMSGTGSRFCLEEYQLTRLNCLLAQFVHLGP